MLAITRHLSMANSPEMKKKREAQIPVQSKKLPLTMLTILATRMNWETRMTRRVTRTLDTCPMDRRT